MKVYEHKVQYYETDKMQITHHSNYIRFMEEARIDFLDQIGWGYDKMEEQGILSPVVGVTCEYKKVFSRYSPDVHQGVGIERCKAKPRLYHDGFGQSGLYGQQHPLLPESKRTAN